MYKRQRSVTTCMLFRGFLYFEMIFSRVMLLLHSCIYVNPEGPKDNYIVDNLK